MESLAREVRFLNIYALLTTLALVVVALSRFRSDKKRAFSEIDVERINIVEPNGKIDLAISNQKRFPPPVVNGRVMQRSGEHSPGMIFFNGNGDEQGGMGWNGATKDGKYSAYAGLKFDQYNQDQTVGLVYEDDNGQRVAGLRVWDHPDTPITDIWDKLQAIDKMKPGPEKDAALKRLHEEWGSQRVFVGKQDDKSAVLLLADEKGRTRIKIAVDHAGSPSIVFLDESGKDTFSLPPK
jgi:hypothetical protein